MNKPKDSLSSELLACTQGLVEICQDLGDYFVETDTICQFPEKVIQVVQNASPIKKSAPSFVKKPLEKPVEIPQAAPEDKPKEVSEKIEKRERKDFSNFFSLIEKLLPQLKLVRDPPLDTQAKQALLKEKALGKWQVDVLILFTLESQEDLTFLRAVAKAIDLELGKVKLVDADKLQESDFSLLGEKSFSLVIAHPHFTKKAKLIELYRENPTQGQKFLGPSPLFVLENLSNYYQDPVKKKQLWLSLCNYFRKNS